MGKKTVGKKVWKLDKSTKKFEAENKVKILEILINNLEKHARLKEKISRYEMRGNRIYLYELEEQIITEGIIYTKPLIKEKYLEMPYARITVEETEGKECTLDWQRYNEQWVPVYKGTLEECLETLKNNEGYF